MPDDVDDVMGVIAQQIETRFHMSLPELRRAVMAAPRANQQATEVVHWFGLLAESQTALERAEDDLVAVLIQDPVPLDDPAMERAHRVNAAVTVRDGRALVVRHLLDSAAPAGHRSGPRLGAALAIGRGPALQTSPPTRPSAPAVPVRGATR
ncbi:MULTISPECIES: hypothetical protein [Streptomyces]|uniref:hypothetical protein n=1 Tax=Streptomyces TaxID=1883 RepID=UPI00163CA5DE|nr:MULTISPECIES: hypothetical protein [Streptomyces]MBC2878083.1 hypothetical protein [Streptomyces sp. TYQ1024]UBI40031.1 hypothetical protein K7I03_28590 [Streptomyces mobaraensis]UKW32611.1 hypothetical protein MCU78_28520 [Streptomyces sp. TYQ1024]